MKAYITDNPNIHKNIPGSLLVYYLYSWKAKKINENEESGSYEVIFLKRWKSGEVKRSLRSHTSISCIVAPSNYRLIYDVLAFSKEHGIPVTFYTWNGWLKGRKFSPDVKKTKRLFEGYMQRGFLSRSLYFELGSMNMQRIEQFMVALAVEGIHLGILKKEMLSDKKDPLFNAVSILTKYKDRGMLKAMEKIVYHFRNIDIADPFIKGEVSFTPEGKKKSLYKILSNVDTFPGISDLQFVANLLKQIIPLVDVYKTFLFLLKQDMISCDGLRCRTNISLEKSEILQYLPYIDPSLWKEIYKSGRYMFSDFFPYIGRGRSEFTCPVCGGIKFSASPLWFKCKNPSCSFKIKRLINPLGKAQKIKEEDFKRLVSHGSVYLRNRNGGYSRYTLEKNRDGSYWPKPA